MSETPERVLTRAEIAEADIEILNLYNSILFDVAHNDCPEYRKGNSGCTGPEAFLSINAVGKSGCMVRVNGKPFHAR